MTTRTYRPTGALRSETWMLWWDHTGPEHFRWWALHRDEDIRYVVSRDEGRWFIAQPGHDTVDQRVSLHRLAETELVEEEGWRELVRLLDEVYPT